MSSSKLWIFVLTGLTFLGGGVSGYLLALLNQPRTNSSVLAGYEELLIQTYELDQKSQKNLGMAVADFERGLDALQAQVVRQEMEPELIQLGETLEGQIREYVIPPERLKEFDAASAGIALLSPSSDASRPAR